MIEIFRKHKEKPLTIKDQINALQMALNKGVDADKLIDLGKGETFTLEDGKKRFLRWVEIGAVGIIGGGLMAKAFVPDVNIGETTRQIFDIVFNAGGAPVAEASLKIATQQFFRWLSYFGQNSIVFSLVLEQIQSSLTMANQIKTFNKNRYNLSDAIKAGEAPIAIKNYTGIDLGRNDAIGREIGRQLGWGKGALPFIEGNENVSGYELWAKLPNPSNGINKEEFFKVLDKMNFVKAKRMIFCPVKEEHAFLPDVKNPNHFDLGFDEIVDRVRLIDEYCKLRNIPLKEIIIIADKNMERSVAPYTENGKKPETQTYTLEGFANAMNMERDSEASIIIVDPTETILRNLISLEFNPKGLPLEFYEDPKSPCLLGPAFVKRCREMVPPIDVKTNGDPDVEALRVVCGNNDVSTLHTTGMLGPKNIAPIVIDQARGQNPYKTLVLADLVARQVIGYQDKIFPTNKVFHIIDRDGKEKLVNIKEQKTL